jgi:short-chain Z-isoprenyl diphosphate synthase
VRAIGELALVPASTIAAIQSAEQATRAYDAMELNIAVAYGGREEIVDAVRASLRKMACEGATLSEAIERLTPDAIARHLYTAGLPDPDLIIRTSGEIRLSGFMLSQSAHSEFYFSDVNWPAFRRVDFLRAIRAYQGRQRRLGR